MPGDRLDSGDRIARFAECRIKKCPSKRALNSRESCGGAWPLRVVVIGFRSRNEDADRRLFAGLSVSVSARCRTLAVDVGSRVEVSTLQSSHRIRRRRLNASLDLRRGLGRRPGAPRLPVCPRRPATDPARSTSVHLAASFRTCVDDPGGGQLPRLVQPRGPPVVSRWENGDVCGIGLPRRRAGTPISSGTAAATSPTSVHTGHGTCQAAPADRSDFIVVARQRGTPISTNIGTSSRWGNGERPPEIRVHRCELPDGPRAAVEQLVPPFQGLHVATGHSGDKMHDTLDSSTRAGSSRPTRSGSRSTWAFFTISYFPELRPPGRG